jgi:hypothetical protein
LSPQPAVGRGFGSRSLSWIGMMMTGKVPVIMAMVSGAIAGDNEKSCVVGH